MQVYGSFWWGIKLRSVTEYHGGPKCLTRIHLDTHMVATTFLVNLVLLGILAYQQFLTESNGVWLGALWLAWLIWVGILVLRARRLKRRVADLVGAAAQRCKFTRVKG